jgi:hypothetical protein
MQRDFAHAARPGTTRNYREERHRQLRKGLWVKDLPK